MTQKKLYGVVFVAVIFLVIAALGGGLFNQPGLWFDHWQHKAFRGLCHQDPQRAYWIAGTPMAVCSRCFGIYAGFFVSWLTLPFVGSWIHQIRSYLKKILIGAVAINIMDVMLNFVGIWQNTLDSRLLAGLLLGLSVAFVIGFELLEKTQTNLKGIHYGTDTSG